MIFYYKTEIRRIDLSENTTKSKTGYSRCYVFSAAKTHEFYPAKRLRFIFSKSIAFLNKTTLKLAVLSVVKYFLSRLD